MKFHWPWVFDLGALALLITFVMANLALVMTLNPAATGLGTAFAINGLVLSIGVFLALRRNLPLMMTVFGFHYVFFSLAPLQQIAVNYRSLLEYANMTSIMVLVFTATIACFAALVFSSAAQRPSAKIKLMERSILDGPVRFFPLFIAALVINAALFLYFRDVIFTNREFFDRKMFGLGPQMGIVFHAYALPFSVITPVIGVAMALRRRRFAYAGLFALLALVGFAMVNPTTIARYQASAAIFFVILIVVGWRSPRLIFCLFSVGLLISPLLNVFRYSKPALGSNSQEFMFVHIDYELIPFINASIEYVNYYGISWGSNIVSSVLFFIPRSIWGDKLEHLGAVMSGTSILAGRYGTDNLTSPAGAEGYFAFGIIGGIVWSFSYPLAFAWLERRALRSQVYSPWQLVACGLPSLVLITFRGPPVVGISETLGAVIIAAGAGLLLRWRPLNQAISMRRRHLGLHQFSRTTG